MTDIPPSRRNLWGRRGSIALPPHKLDAAGKRLCRWCWEPVPKGRHCWCSAACVADYRQRADWAFICQQIIDRDKVCQCCGGAMYVAKGGKWRIDTGYTPRQAYRFAWALEADLVWGNFNVLVVRWEVDHILSVADGGTDEPRNLRLLCAPCHRLRTAVWLRDRAERRRLITLEVD